MPRRAALPGQGLLALLLTCLTAVLALACHSPWSTGGSRENIPPCPIGNVSAQTLLTPSMQKPVIPVEKKAWEKSVGGERAAQPYLQARLSGWPRRLLVERGSLPTDDRRFAERVARDTWRGLAALTDRDNGLPIDNVRLGESSVAIAEAHIGDYTSGTNVGLHLMAVVGAQQLGLLSAGEAVARIRKVLETLAHLESRHGFLFNFYDTTSLERTSGFLSFVDASWLTTGLMVARMTFPELYEPCTELIDREDFGFFYNAKKEELSHGYYVDAAARSPYDYGVLYTEARIGSLIAIGKGDVPVDEWFAMTRAFPPTCGWQHLRPRDSRRKTVLGHEVLGGYAEWRGVRYVPSWGGSMFEALMPTLVLDEGRYASRSLGANDLAHALVQRRYATEVLGYPVWGISPSATPGGGDYGEYGVPVLGARGYPVGAVTPHASALALSVTPGPALANLRELARRYDVYGDFGFYDAVDPLSGAVAHDYLTLDQSMLFVALANYLGDGTIRERFAADPIVQKVLPLIGAEDFFD